MTPQLYNGLKKSNLNKAKLLANNLENENCILKTVYGVLKIPLLYSRLVNVFFSAYNTKRLNLFNFNCTVFPA